MLDRSYSPAPSPFPNPDSPEPSLWHKLKKFFVPLAVLVAVLAKFKGLLVLLLKFVLPVLKFFPAILKTGGTMLLTIWVYAMTWGVWYAAGFVLLLLIHECGHLVAAKRLGLKVGAPVFIPFMGAAIALKESPPNAWVEAQVGIGGPLLGTLGAVLCYGLYPLTGHPIFGALAFSGFFLNLFNLTPIGFLDGGRIVTVISPWLWVVGTVITTALMIIHFNFLLLLILVLSLPRVFSLFRRKTAEEARYFEVTPRQRLVMSALYFGLAALLAFGMRFSQLPP